MDENAVKFTELASRAELLSNKADNDLEIIWEFDDPADGLQLLKDVSNQCADLHRVVVEMTSYLSSSDARTTKERAIIRRNYNQVLYKLKQRVSRVKMTLKKRSEEQKMKYQSATIGPCSLGSPEYMTAEAHAAEHSLLPPSATFDMLCPAEAVKDQMPSPDTLRDAYASQQMAVQQGQAVLEATAANLERCSDSSMRSYVHVRPDGGSEFDQDTLTSDEIHNIVAETRRDELALQEEMLLKMELAAAATVPAAVETDVEEVQQQQQQSPRCSGRCCSLVRQVLCNRAVLAVIIVLQVIALAVLVYFKFFA